MIIIDLRNICIASREVEAVGVSCCFYGKMTKDNAINEIRMNSRLYVERIKKILKTFRRMFWPWPRIRELIQCVDMVLKSFCQCSIETLYQPSYVFVFVGDTLAIHF